MNLWCPQCGNTHFYYDKVGEAGSTTGLPEEIMVTDHLKCKNRGCNFEFNITWFAYIREEWIQQFSESKRMRRMNRG